MNEIWKSVSVLFLEKCYKCCSRKTHFFCQTCPSCWLWLLIRKCQRRLVELKLKETIIGRVQSRLPMIILDRFREFVLLKTFWNIYLNFTAMFCDPYLFTFLSLKFNSILIQFFLLFWTKRDFCDFLKNLDFLIRETFTNFSYKTFLKI